MSYSILTTPDFDKEFKRLARKHHSLVNDLAGLLDALEKDPTQGTPLGNNCFKIRLSIKSKASGKSGEARVITYVAIRNETVYLAGIYDKSEQATISDKEITKRLRSLL